MAGEPNPLSPYESSPEPVPSQPEQNAPSVLSEPEGGSLPVSSEVLSPAPQPPPIPRPPWNIWDVFAIFLVVIVASWVALGVVIGMRGKPVGGNVEALARDPFIIIPAQAAAYLIGFGVMVFLLKIRGLKFWKTIEWSWPRHWPWFAVGGAVLSYVIGILSSRLPVPKQLPIDLYFSTTKGVWLMAFFGTMVAPFIEELFFRGFLYPVLERRWGMSMGTILTAALFALTHESQLAQAWAPLLMLFVVGLVLTSVRATTRSVAASWLVHTCYNGMLFTAMYIATDHFHHLEKLK